MPMKKYLIISSLLFALSSTVALAASDDFIANGEITTGSVVGSGVTAALIIRSGSRAESWTYSDGNSLQVTNAHSSSRFKVGSDSASVISMRVNNSNGNEIACTDGNTGVEVPAGSGIAYTVYPSNATCSSAVVRGTSGSGGGGTSVTPAIPATPAVPTVSPAVPASSALMRASFRASFNRQLVIGSVGDDVKSLQQFLNGQGFTVSPAGPGAPGNETKFFGPATRAAVIKFQLANGIIQSATEAGAGHVGPKTRAKINGLNGAASIAPAVGQLAPVGSLRQNQLNQLVQLLQLLRQLQAPR